MKKLILTLSIASAALLGWAAPVEYWVSTSGDDTNAGTEAAPFRTITKATSKLLAGKEAIIHLEPNAKFLESASVQMGENMIVKIIGDNTTFYNAEVAPADGGEGKRILRIATGCDVEISGVNFINGRQVGDSPGGAIFSLAKKLTLENCVFAHNQAGTAGAGVSSRGGEVIVKNCIFNDNRLLSGWNGGVALVHIGNPSYTTNTLYVENCTFTGNYLNAGDGWGSAITAYEKSAGTAANNHLQIMDIRNCTFSGNYAQSAAGVRYDVASIDLKECTVCSLRLINNTFYNEAFGVFVRATPGKTHYIFNNFMYCTNKCVACPDYNATVASGKREEIVGYNNVLVAGQSAINGYIDDKCFNADAAPCNNLELLSSAAAPASFGLTPIAVNGLTRYMALGNGDNADKLLNKGLDDTSVYSGDNLVPQFDCRNAAVVDTRDIGAYERRQALKEGLVADNYYTLCLPIGTTCTDACLYTIDSQSSDATQLYLAPVASGVVEAGKAYVIKPTTSGDLTFELTGDHEVAAPASDDILVGNFDEAMVPVDMHFIKNNVWYKSFKGKDLLPPYSAYLNLAEVPENGVAPEGVQEMAIDNATNAIELIEAENDAVREVFNLKGQRVADDARGILIVNGRKVVIK